MLLFFDIYSSILYTTPMETTENIKENKMGVMPVGKLLMNMSLPMMLSMFVQALYNIVDSVFVSQINESALTAVSLAFPFQTLMISVGVGTAVGINALLSMRLGQKNQEAVNKAAMNGLFLAGVNFLLFFVVCLVFVNSYLTSQTRSALVVQYGKSYLDIVMLGSAGMFFGITFDRLLQSTGKTLFTMGTQLLGAFTNIILDPLLIFGIGPFPAMGIAGAALATIAGQYAGLILSIIFNLKFNNEVHLKLKGFKPDAAVIGQIYKVGLPSIVLQAVGSATTYGMNLILGTFHEIADTAIAVYGAYFKLNSFIFMPVFGLNNGTVPIIAYNYGAKNYDRIMKTIKAGLASASVIMVVGMIIFEAFPDELYSLFNASDQMKAIGSPALRIIAPSFIGAAVAISLGSVFSALGSAVYSMVVSVARQLLILLPSAYLLSLAGNIDNVWWCFIIAEVMSVGLSLFYYERIYRKKIKPLQSGQ